MLLKYNTKLDSIEKERTKRLIDFHIDERKFQDILFRSLDRLFPDDELIMLMQSQRWREEPDLMALDKNANLYIFELKAWESIQENILQVLRYGQLYGDADLEKITHWFNKFHGSDIDLEKAFEDKFNKKLNESNCNQKQANGDNNKNNNKNNSKNNKKEKEEGKAGEPAAPPDVDPELLDFARKFQNEVAITHGNTAPKITDALIVDGALELERAVRIDGLEINEIKLALMWAVHDDFWGQNLKSMARMRTKTKAGVTKIQSAIGEYRRHAGRSNENRDRWAGAI